MSKKYPQVAYGAVYYRRSNPPRIDWERDYAQAEQDGMNLFRHWFLWNAIETQPGVFNWEPYDRQLDLAAQHHIGTVIAEFQTVPEWLIQTRPDLLCEGRDKGQVINRMGGSSVTGGFTDGGLCLDHEASKDYAGRFLRELAGRYRHHPGLFGFDVWNECNYSPNVCYCPATQEKFRAWLKRKYATIENLAEAWHRYGVTDWSQIQAPRYEEQYPECMDWLTFRKENFYDQMQWRIDTIKSVDPDCHITAHGVAGSLDYTYGDGNDDWLAASKVESYGMTWVIARKGSEPWKQWHAVDLVRAASRGRIFWHAEMQGGPLWLQPQVVGRPSDDGRVATADDVRLWNLVSLAGGARGILYLRWRSLLEGPLFGAFGLYSNDGLPNPRSAMAARIASWANQEKTAGLFAAQPVQGEIGIIVLDQIQEFNRLMQQAGKGKFYSRCAWGAYQAFHAMNIQADWVHFDDLDDYRFLYFAYPIQLNAGQADKIKRWIAGGGTLVSEGLIGYFGDRGHVGTIQPNLGLDDVFGVREDEVAFMPDLSEDIRFSLADGSVADIPGGLFQQSYVLNNAECFGRYPDGSAATVVHPYGQGLAMLVGTFPSEGYFRSQSAKILEWLKAVLDRIGLKQRVVVEGDPLVVRICAGESGTYVWALNHGSATACASVTISGFSRVGEMLWGYGTVQMADGRFNLSVPAKDALVFRIEP